MSGRETAADNAGNSVDGQHHVPGSLFNVTPQAAELGDRTGSSFVIAVTPFLKVRRKSSNGTVKIAKLSGAPIPVVEPEPQKTNKSGTSSADIDSASQRSVDRRSAVAVSINSQSQPRKIGDRHESRDSAAQPSRSGEGSGSDQTSSASDSEESDASYSSHPSASEVHEEAPIVISQLPDDVKDDDFLPNVTLKGSSSGQASVIHDIEPRAEDRGTEVSSLKQQSVKTVDAVLVNNSETHSAQSPAKSVHNESDTSESSDSESNSSSSSQSSSHPKLRPIDTDSISESESSHESEASIHEGRRPNRALPVTEPIPPPVDLPHEKLSWTKFKMSKETKAIDESLNDLLTELDHTGVVRPFDTTEKVKLEVDILRDRIDGIKEAVAIRGYRSADDVLNEAHRSLSQISHQIERDNEAQESVRSEINFLHAAVDEYRRTRDMEQSLEMLKKKLDESERIFSYAHNKQHRMRVLLEETSLERLIYVIRSARERNDQLKTRLWEPYCIGAGCMRNLARQEECACFAKLRQFKGGHQEETEIDWKERLVEAQERQWKERMRNNFS